MTTAGKSLSATLLIVMLVAGVTAVGYARWTRPIAEADRALDAGQWDHALAAYATAEARFDRIPVARQFLADDYTRTVANQLWLLYRMQRYDDLIGKAERAPERALPHFWSGLAFFAKARSESKPDAQLGWLARAEEELRRAVEADSSDWDTKYDFELATRLVSELRKQPKTPPNQLMQLLRPQPKAGAKPGRRVG
jgi:tetratricopeptide (TPR) repeat protein